MNLLVDMGNTRLKWVMHNDRDFSTSQSIDNTNINQATLFQQWNYISPPDQVAVSCVSTNQLYATVVAVANMLWPGVPVNRAKSEATTLGLTNAYQTPEKLGVDRWLSLIAGYHQFQQALCIVSCGTAVTVDMVDESGNHLGGLISPGLRLMREALRQATANLDANESTCPFGIATDTDAAISHGTLSAICGLIEFSLQKRGNLQLLLTGGDAETVATQLTIPYIIIPDLVLRGLSLTSSKPP